MTEGQGERRPRARRVRFSPLRVTDALGAMGALAFSASLFWGEYVSASVESAVREAGLLFAVAAVVVRVLDLSLRRRDKKADARRELMRRLGALNDSLMDLRKSLSRDQTRRFLDRRADFAAGLSVAEPWITVEERRLALDCGEFCDGLSRALAETVQRRTGIKGLADRVGREIDRAARRGDMDGHDADNLTSLIEDAIGVMDEAVYAEWNADHFGRLTAGRRHFLREVERYRSPAADQIEHHGVELFDQVIAHVAKKVELVDMLQAWTDTHRTLELRLAGVDILPSPEERRRFSERFTSGGAAVGRGAAGDFPKSRLPAAND